MTPSVLLKPTSTASVTMQAIVLMCLMGSSMAQGGDYTWGGPGEKESNSENVCLMDQASCGCCLMQQQIHRMKTFFNMSLIALEKELSNAQTALNNVQGSRSAFSVAITNDKSLNCIGPFRDVRIIAYKHVFINLGDGYSVDTGVFTVPRSGVYSLALTVYSDSGSPGNSLAACASLLVNDQVVAEPSEKNMQDQEDSATIVMAVHLKAGDRVAVNLPIGCFLCDDHSHYNTFTGFLLYATD